MPITRELALKLYLSKYVSYKTFANFLGEFREYTNDI